MFCLDRRREDDDVRLGEHDQVVGRDVDGVQPHRRLEHVLVVDADDQRLRPELPRRQRDRTANQAEADDADLVEDRRLPSTAGNGRPGCNADRYETQATESRRPTRRGATGSRQMLRPIAGAMIRSSAIRRSNCAGNIDCAPSLSA